MRCAVLGSPISHSLSPLLHAAAYRSLGLDWTYDAVEVTADSLADFIRACGPEWRGLSLTMPLKRAVQPLLDSREPVVEATGVANTVLFTEGRRVGLNTDIPGAVAALRERTTAAVESAVVLGGGATATSVLWALADLGLTSALLVVRSTDRAAETVEVLARHPKSPEIEVTTFSRGRADGADIVVSTIPAEAQTPDLLAGLAAPVVFEVLYDPWPTPLAQVATSEGRVLVSGLDLLVHQAALQVTAMTGRPAPLAAMRAAGEAELMRRQP